MSVFLVLMITAVASVLLMSALLRRGDEKRIKAYINEEGGNILDARLALFGSEPHRRRLDRPYQVRFLDRNCHEHEAMILAGTDKGPSIIHDEIVRVAERWDFRKGRSVKVTAGSKKPQNAADGFGSYLTMRMRYQPKGKSGKANKSNASAKPTQAA